MIATIEGRKSLDIPETLEEYSNMAGNTRSDFVLSGCDTTSVLCRIGILYQHHSKCWNLTTVGELVYICTWQIFCCMASLVACCMVTVLYGMTMVCLKNGQTRWKIVRSTLHQGLVCFHMQVSNFNNMHVDPTGCYLGKYTGCWCSIL